MPNPENPRYAPTVEPSLAAEGLVAIEGRNFSGRTDLLRSFVGLVTPGTAPSANDAGRRAFIGPEIYNALSGLALSVRDEIRLHLDRSRGSPLDQDYLLEVLGLAPVRDRNPFELSGGEQALTTLAAGLALAPERLSLDCCFEQVDADMRERVLQLLRLEVEQGTNVALADNRLNEYSLDSFRRVRRLSETSNTASNLPALAPITMPQRISSGTSSSAIVLEGIRFSYPHHESPVLLDVSITLEPGQVYLLEGKNGSGKSTLAKILCGALRPQAGVLLADGSTFRPWREPARVFAYHFQNPDLQLFCSSVKDELAAGPMALGMDPEQAEVGALCWAQVFGLSQALAWHPLDLPFVGRKRVAIAATLTMGRPWLILDEPTLGQDDRTSETLGRIVKELTKCGIGVLVISHSVEFRRQVAGHRLVLEGGILTERE